MLHKGMNQVPARWINDPSNIEQLLVAYQMPQLLMNYSMENEKNMYMGFELGECAFNYDIYLRMYMYISS